MEAGDGELVCHAVSRTSSMSPTCFTRVPGAGDGSARSRAMSDCSHVRQTTVERGVSFSKEVTQSVDAQSVRSGFSAKVHFVLAKARRTYRPDSDSDSPSSVQTSPAIKRRPTGRKHKPKSRKSSNSSNTSSGPAGKMSLSLQDSDVEYRATVQRRGTGRRPAKPKLDSRLEASSSTDTISAIRVDKSKVNSGHHLGKRNSKDITSVAKSASNPVASLSTQEKNAARRSLTATSIPEDRGEDRRTSTTSSGILGLMRKLKLQAAS